MQRDNENERKRRGFDEHGQHGIQCKNYKVCGSTLPDWWYKCKGRYLCSNCDMIFGTWTSVDGDVQVFKTGKGELDFESNIRCPVCFETADGVSYPNCDHKACIQCFKRSWYGDHDETDRPKFPFPEIEDEYYDDRHSDTNTKWAKYRPQIDAYEEEDRAWEDIQMEKCQKEEYLRKCPLCRK